MTEKERAQIEEIVRRANHLLEEWGIDKRIEIEEKRKAEWLWGKGWEFPEAIFTFDGREVGVCIAPVVKSATGAEYVYSRLWGRKVWFYWKGRRWVSEITMDFILAVRAFEDYLHHFKTSTHTFIDTEGNELVIRIWFCTPPESVGVRTGDGRKGFLYIRNDLVKEGSVHEIMRGIIKSMSILTL